MRSVNLPVSDLERSKAFYSALGFTINPRFTDHNAACIVVEEDHSALMLLMRDYFQTFTERPIADPATTVGAVTAIFLDTGRRSTLPSGTASPRVVRRRSPPLTTASCTSDSSPTPTATSSSSATWTRPPRRTARRPS